jgi:hypothetical protein
MESNDEELLDLWETIGGLQSPHTLGGTLDAIITEPSIGESRAERSAVLSFIR